MYLLFVLVVILQEVWMSSADDVKIWNTNTNYDNPRNWADGRLPCAKDRVVFPKDAQIVTWLPKILSFSDMVLPMDGELIFQDETSLRSEENAKDSCKGQDAIFVVSTDSWYDPDKWNISSPNALPKGEPKRNAAVPHAYSIPCQTDRVVFPSATSFKVIMDSTPLSIYAISINGINYDNSELQEMLASHTGKLLFAGSPRMSVTGNDCRDRTGCICGNDDPQSLSKICSHITCPPLKCSDPVKAVGHCCPFCGAYLEFQYEEGFSLYQLASYLELVLQPGKEEDYRYVESFTAKTYQGSIQTVYVDVGGDFGAAGEVAERIHRQLKDDMKRANTYRLRSVKLFKSDQWNAGVPRHSLYSSPGLSSGGVAAIVIIITAIIGAAVAWYIYKKRHIPGFSFARFDFHSSKVELELGTTPHDELEPDDSPTAMAGSTVTKAFDNPVYDTAKDIKEKPLIENLETEGEERQENVVENPMFMMFDPKQSE